MYSRDVLTTLILMILLGAGRTIVVKVGFQLGYDDPLLITVLLLVGHALALPLYLIGKLYQSNRHKRKDVSKDSQRTADLTEEISHNDNEAELAARPIFNVSSLGSGIVQLNALQWAPEASWLVSERDLDYDEDAQVSFPSEIRDEESLKSTTSTGNRPTLLSKGYSRGSKTGLTEKSKAAAAWVHQVPWWAQPLLSSFLGVLDTTFRMLSVLYLAASVAELLSGGLELIVSILASRFIRHRQILKQRWYGAGVMVVGLVLIAASDLTGPDREGSSRSLGLGVLFIVLKVILGVLKDLAQEIFMQEANLSATLLLGLEGLYGVIMAVPLYFAVGPLLGFNPVESFQILGSSTLAIGYTFFLILVVFLAGIYSILGTAVTSSMTRNMWKNFRGLVVWMIALLIFYASVNSDLGEPWTIPGSFMILVGFFIMMVGLKVYYHVRNESEGTTTKPTTEAAGTENAV